MNWKAALLLLVTAALCLLAGGLLVFVAPNYLNLHILAFCYATLAYGVVAGYQMGKGR